MSTLTVIGLLALQAAVNFKTRTLSTIKWTDWRNPLGSREVPGGKKGTTIRVPIHDSNVRECFGTYQDPTSKKVVAITERISGLNGNSMNYSWSQSFPTVIVNDDLSTKEGAIVCTISFKYANEALITGTTLRDAFNQTATDLHGSLTSGESAVGGWDAIRVGNLPSKS